MSHLLTPELKVKARKREWTKRDRLKNPEKYRKRHAARRAYYRLWAATACEKNPEKHRAYKKQYRLDHPEKAKSYGHLWRLKKYGLTQQDYDAMFTAQSGKCAICLFAPATAIDHCHRTKRVRGLLCGCCNRAIGLLRDDSSSMLRAAEYVTRQTNIQA